MVFLGLAARKRSIPDFKDILQYLEYLKLNEPIIGKYPYTFLNNL